MLNRMASGSPASVCRITGRPVAAPATSAMRAIRAIAASTICAAAASSSSGEASFSMRLSDATSTKSGGLSFSSRAVSLEPGFRLLIFRDRDVEQEFEPDRGADQRVGDMRGGAGRQDQDPDRHQPALPRLGREVRRRRFQNAADFPAEQAKIGFTPAPPAPATAGISSACSGSAGSDASCVAHLAGRARKPGQRLQRQFCGGIVDTGAHSPRAFLDQVEQIAAPK